MFVKLPYDKNTIEVDIPEENLEGFLEPIKVAPKDKSENIIKAALEKPIGSKPLKEIIKPGERVAIVTSDITRPCPSKIMLPPILEALEKTGVSRENITIVFALGSHRPHTEEEKRYLVGNYIFENYRCIDHDPNDCVPLGKTSRGTPIEIFRPVVEANRRICLGNIEFHYFAGYSGGAKAIFPGVSTPQAIQANHSMMLDSNAKTGKANGNPVREDLEEVGRTLRIDFILNSILSAKKEILYAVAGHYIEAHRAGCKILDSIGKVPIGKEADIVIVSAGGYPKDINVYQAQKALDNAAHAVRSGGIIIWIASCKEGFGSKVFEEWLKDATCPQDLLKKVEKSFQLGGHKAAAIAMVSKKASIWMVSDLPEEIVKLFFATPFYRLDEAVKKALLKLGKDSRILIMPTGSSTLPEMAKRPKFKD